MLQSSLIERRAAHLEGFGKIHWSCAPRQPGTPRSKSRSVAFSEIPDKAPKVGVSCASPVSKSERKARSVVEESYATPPPRKTADGSRLPRATKSHTEPRRHAEAGSLTPSRPASTRSGRKVRSVRYTEISCSDDEVFTSEADRKQTPRSRRKLNLNVKPNKLQINTGLECDTSDDEDPNFDEVFASCLSSSEEEDDDFQTPTKKLQKKPSAMRTPRTSAKKTLPGDATDSADTADSTDPKNPSHGCTCPLCRPVFRAGSKSLRTSIHLLKGKLQDGTGGCMYISGVPGTGKTATVHDVLRVLQESVDGGHVPSFKFVEVNGMKLTSPAQCYSHILRALTGENATPEQAAELLSRRFERPGPRHDPIVLLVDELDLLWTRKQQVLYNLFDWPTKPKSRLIVLTIANTMDLPERLMSNRVSSRLGLTRMTFHPYNHKQLQEIVLSRMQGLEAFDPDAVQLVARKQCPETRRALDVCRRATEIAEHSLHGSPKKTTRHVVGMAHVDCAIQEMFSSPKIRAIRCLSQQEQIFLRAVVAEFRRTGVEETTFSKVYNQHITICRLEGVKPPNFFRGFQRQLTAVKLPTTAEA
ncbi:hypothetical protein MRX96_014036 [Rhipicephalus microplus]